MGRLTLYGMYNYDNSLFDGMVLPDGLDADVLRVNILDKCGDLYTYHQHPAMIKDLIGYWFTRNYLNFSRMLNALTAVYNPIENYDRNEKWTRTPDLTDVSQLSGDDTLKASDKDTTTTSYTNYKETTTYKGDDISEKEVSAFDSGSYQPAEKVTDSRNQRADELEISGSQSVETTYGRQDKTTYGKKDTQTHKGKEEFESRIHGNIGVTTNQQLIQAELELRKIDIYNDITARFEREFIVQLY